MSNKKSQNAAVSQMIQRCHKWRQKRKQYIDQARQTNDSVERERLLQMAEHFCRVANEEQLKIDSLRDVKDKAVVEEIETAEKAENSGTENAGEEEEIPFPEFITNL